jgi:purine-nucleoside phosphorylase
MDGVYDRAAEAASWLKAQYPAPAAAIILGSGLGALADQLEDATTFAFEDIPHFPKPKVSGHAGTLVVGRLPGCQGVVAALAGRVHIYEGHPVADVVHAVRTLRLWGVSNLMITNAAGGIDPAFEPGDLMLITDHINLSGHNPLQGMNDERLGVRFPDMGAAYDPELNGIVRAAAAEDGLRLREGVYAGVPGPSYETPAEIRMLRICGANAVGMSTVCEVIAGHHAGLRTCGISCVTNLAAGLGDEPLDHADVKDVARRVRAQFLSLVIRALDVMATP